MSVVLAANSLTIGYGTTCVATGLSLHLRAGRLTCLLGPNGAGKSTLLRTLCGMQKPLAGEVLLNQRNVHAIPARELARLLGVVLTESVQVGLLSAYELVALGRHPFTDWSGRLREEDHRVIRAAIESVGAQDLAGRPFHELSDGERQKVMMARALAQEPKLLVLDEITAFLDLPRRVDIMRTLRRLAHDSGATVLLSTHDLDLALRSADDLWLLQKGGLLHTGAPEDLVLDGRFAEAFRSEGVEFDALAGHFSLQVPTEKTIALNGNGLRGIWTRRALERAGWRVSETATSRVDVQADGWMLSHQNEANRYERLGSLIDALR